MHSDKDDINSKIPNYVYKMYTNTEKNANNPVCTENANTILLLTTKQALASSLRKQVENYSQCAKGLNSHYSPSRIYSVSHRK